MLHQMMSGKDAPADPILIPPHGVVSRQSTDVLAIRESSEPAGELATRFGVSRSTIVNILNRNTWKHI